MVLDLLVDDEEDDEDDSGEERVQETDRDDDDGGDGRADQRYEVEQGYEESERNGEGDAEQKQHERRQRARDQADSEVARDVAADLAVDAVADRAPARLRLRRQEAVKAFHPCRSLEEHEEREKRDRDGTDDQAEDALRYRDRGAGQSEQFLRSALMHVLLEPLHHVVLRLEETEPSLALGQVVDISRSRIDEVVDVVDERRDEREADRRDGCQHEQASDRRGEAS